MKLNFTRARVDEIQLVLCEEPPVDDKTEDSANNRW